MDDLILSGDLRLSAHVALPDPPRPSLGLVLCHGLPNPPRGAASVGTTYPDLADHIAHEAGWTVLTFNFRGTGISEGDFSAAGWIEDLRNAVRTVHARPDVRGVWVAGFGHGGTFAVCEAADDHLVRGVATIASPSTLRDWAQEPGRLLGHARSMGMIRTEGFPRDAARWVRDIGRVDAIAAAARLDRRPLLVLHGVEDAEVPVEDARRARRRRPSELRAPAGAGGRSPTAPRSSRHRDAARMVGPAGAERGVDRGAGERLTAVSWRGQPAAPRRASRRASVSAASRSRRRASSDHRPGPVRRRRARARCR